jgi:NAD(P)-dependent dehydrogenase (short-subunit alcohol dehydrogenase family)
VGRLDGKVALITGAGAGIGRACMQRFAEEGARVFGVSRTQRKLEAICAELGPVAACKAADLSNEDEAAAAVAAAIAHFGKLDIVVNCAGVGYSWAEVSPHSMDAALTTPPAKWREVIGINLDSMFYVCRAALPHMLAAKAGAIVNVSSILGLTGNGDGHAYTAAKGGINAFTKSLCAAYAKDGIRANVLCPGFIDTEMIAVTAPVFAEQRLADRIVPMGRRGTAMEMANACLFLASDEASYFNGSIVVADGGVTSRAVPPLD